MSLQQYNNISGAQVEELIKGYEKAEEMIKRGEIKTQQDLEKVFQAEFNKTFPDNYPVPLVRVYLDKKTTTAGQYNPVANELYVNVAVSPAEQVSTMIHEREHAIQSKKVSDYIAQDLVAKGKPLTAENIVAASSALISQKRVDANGKPVLKDKKPIIDQATISVSIAVAKESVKDYQNKKTLSPSQKEEAKKLFQSGYTVEGRQKRQQFQKSIDKAGSTHRKNLDSYQIASDNYNKARKSGSSVEKIEQLKKVFDNAYKKAVISQAALNSSVKGYENGLIEESQAYKVERKFNGIYKKLENRNKSVKTSSFNSNVSEVSPVIANDQMAVARVSKTSLGEANDVQNISQPDFQIASVNSTDSKISSDTQVNSIESESSGTSIENNNSVVNSSSQSTTNSSSNNSTDISKVIAILKENAAEVKNQYGLDVTTDDGLSKAVMQYWKENNLDPQTLKEQLPNMKSTELASDTSKTSSADSLDITSKVSEAATTGAVENVIDDRSDVSKVVALLRNNAAEVKGHYGLDVTTADGLGKAVMEYWKENNLDPKTLKEQLPDVKESEFNKLLENANAKETTKTKDASQQR